MWKAMILATTLFCGTVYAFNPSVELKESTILDDGDCFFDDKTLKCFLLQKGEKLYMVAFDKEGLYLVFLVREIKEQYEEKEMLRMWKRYRLRDMV